MVKILGMEARKVAKFRPLTDTRVQPIRRYDIDKSQAFYDRLKYDQYHDMTFPDLLCKSPDQLFEEFGLSSPGANTHYMRQGLARARWRDGVIRSRMARAKKYANTPYMNHRNRK